MRIGRIIRTLGYRVSSLTKTRAEHRHALVGPPELWKMKRDFQIQFLKNRGIRPEHYFLDLGCGTLRGGIPLIAYLDSGHYFGIEVRANVLEEGEKELREAGLEGKNPKLLLATELSTLCLNRSFDYIWAFSVLIHMSDRILDDTLFFVSKHLSEQGIFFANINIGDAKTLGEWQSFPVVTRSLEFYSQICEQHGLWVFDLGPLKDHGHITNIEAQDSQRMLRITKNFEYPRID